MNLFFTIIPGEYSGYVQAQKIYIEMFKSSSSRRSSNSSTSDSIQSADSDSHRFRRQVIKQPHQHENMKILKCEISQEEYPAKYVVAVHIFKKSFGDTKIKTLLNLANINACVYRTAF
ncbi:unnamed protein product [Adineta ricciae]|uniref:Uncharacterized protein n=1 Tax=Adineta ricciae TaxID=249248 RepID=A0A816F562_ADIRI|nr:unnamed protein product [Adineta ricciae]